MTDEPIPATAPIEGAGLIARRWRLTRRLLAAKTRARPRLAAALAILVGAFVLTLPIFANGRPFPFTDTATYFQVGYNIIQSVFANAGVPISEFSRAYLAARSPYYGLLVSGVEWIGTMWLVVALNALFSAAMLLITARALCPRRAYRVYLWMTGVLTVFSALPLFVGFVMPDLTVAFAALAIGLLIFFPDRITQGERRFLWFMLTASLAFHTSHVMVALIVAPAALWLHRALRAPDMVERAAPVAGAIAAGMAAWALFFGVNALSAHKFNSPPFLTARVLADGPGRVYLRKQCAADPNAFALCAFKDKPLDSTDAILWGWRNERGVFAIASTPTRLAIIREQRRFVIGTILSDPAGEAWAAVKNFATQLVTVGVDEGFKLDAHYWMTYPPDFYLKKMATRMNLCPEPQRKCPARLPLDAIAVWHTVFLALACVYGAVWVSLAWRERRALDDDTRAFIAFGAVLAVAIVANAAVCGILSGPFARYQARIAWLLPMLVVVAEFQRPLLGPALRVAEARLTAPTP
jgi:hypothetical protein